MDTPFKNCIDCPFCLVHKTEKTNGKKNGKEKREGVADVDCSPLGRIVANVDVSAVQNQVAFCEPPADCPFRNAN